jgi:hypothetical protein
MPEDLGPVAAELLPNPYMDSDSNDMDRLECTSSDEPSEDNEPAWAKELQKERNHERAKLHKQIEQENEARDCCALKEAWKQQQQRPPSPPVHIAPFIQPRRIEPLSNGMPVVSINGYPEQDNHLWNMTLWFVYISPATNTTFIMKTTINAWRSKYGPAWVFEVNCTQPLYKRVPRGFPMNPTELNNLKITLRQRQVLATDLAEAYLLLNSFRRISLSIVEAMHDCTMQEAATDPALKLLVDQPPYEAKNSIWNFEHVPVLNKYLNNKREGPTHGAGIVMPQKKNALNVDNLAQYFLHHCHPGSGNPITGVAMNFASEVHCRSVFGWALTNTMGPGGARNHSAKVAWICTFVRLVS